MVSDQQLVILTTLRRILLPLDSPVHSKVCDNEWRSDVKDLGAESPPGVEESGVKGSGKRTLSVGAQAVVDDALLLWGT